MVNPADLTIELYPAPVLRQKAVPVDLNDEVRAVARRMIELMRDAEGIGLAAPQVGLPWRMFVTEVPGYEDGPPGDPAEWETEPRVYINPELSDPVGPAEPMSEGCLSLPDIRGDVIRPAGITITATDLEGNRFSVRGAGLLARCWQHEYDHLDGVLILDRMNEMHRRKHRPLIREMERDAGLRGG